VTVRRRDEDTAVQEPLAVVRTDGRKWARAGENLVQDARRLRGGVQHHRHGCWQIFRQVRDELAQWIETA
jgi:hypothetical protein